MLVSKNYACAEQEEGFICIATHRFVCSVCRGIKKDIYAFTRMKEVSFQKMMQV